MAISLLKTKTYVPRTSGKLVHRSRLTKRLMDSQESKLILISAPAGFGKTTLLVEWIQDLEPSVAWISLDQNDNDLTRFLAYIILALQGINEDFGLSTLEMLHSTKRLPTETILTYLINEAAEDLASFILVLDDYHVITEKSVHDAITYFLDHLPPQAQVVLSARADPPWPLSRLRARGELVELRAKDLRFTRQEVRQFLSKALGFDLKEGELTALELRTEGWIVGLQMAALSMQGQDDISGFVKALTGSNRFILDYLMEEVLERQPPAIQDFLLRTSILERMSASLCNTLVKGKDTGYWILMGVAISSLQSLVSNHQQLLNKF